MPGPSPAYAGSFRSNVLEFLAAHGNKVPLTLANTRAWIVPLALGKATVRLHVYEELTEDEAGSIPICDQCRNMGGWGRGRVDGRRGHA